MSSSILNFDSEKQEFSVNQEIYDKLDFRGLAVEQLFNKNQSYLIIKNFIDKDVAKKIRDFYSKTKNKESFIQPSKVSNHRIFYYQNSPYQYPKFIISLLSHCAEIKNKIYLYHEFYQIYCMIKGVSPRDYNEVSRLQDLHTWSSVYWYKNGNSHYRHIDDFGELAEFVVFTKKGEDYESGGLVVESEDVLVDMDEHYDYGDLVFLDQSQVFHEVLPVKTIGDQVGRMQLYIPTIPPNYMKDVLAFEGHPYKIYFTDEKIRTAKKIQYWIENIFSEKNYHYSRKIYNHYQENI